MFRTAAAACTAGWITAGCAPALDWRDVRAAGQAAVLLPCKPSAYSRQIELDGQRVEWSIHACTASKVTWALGTADVVDPARVGPTLRHLKAAAAQNLRGQAATEVPLTVPGATPNPESARVRLRGHLPDGRSVEEELALFVAGTRVYQATAIGEVVPADALESFFTSLRVDQ